MAIFNNTTTINSLDAYFSQLQSLTQNNKLFAFVPRDEPTFDINGDTREITVPAIFKKNGISVKGDHYAEILYFTIDRYFEATDLFSDSVKIIIQWEDPTKAQGVSYAVFKDASYLSEQNKILFGWALNDTITKTSGTLKFSVRFYELDGQELVFSLSTLTASATVNSGLDYQFTDGSLPANIAKFANDANKLTDRFRNSVYNDPTTIAEAPVFTIDLPSHVVSSGSYSGATITISGETYRLIDLTDNKYSFKTEATSSEGVVTYIWYHLPLGSTNDPSVISAAGDRYERTSDTTYQATKVYYHATTAGGTTSYSPFNFTAGASIPNDTDDPAVYEKYQGYEVVYTAGGPSVTGDYWVKATNHKNLATTDTLSAKVRIPGPAALTLTIPEGQEHKLLSNGDATLSATGNTEQVGDTITYEWYKVGTDAAVQTNAEQAKNTAVTYSISTVAADARALYDETFKIKAKANRNGDSTVYSEKTCRITDAAHTPIVTLSTSIYDVDGEHPAILTATVNNGGSMVHDEFIYHWFTYSVAGDDTEEYDVDNLENDIQLADPVTSAELTNSITVSAGGHKYYCKVTNKVNGDTSDPWVPTATDQMIALSIR